MDETFGDCPVCKKKPCICSCGPEGERIEGKQELADSGGVNLSTVKKYSSAPYSCWHMIKIEGEGLPLYVTHQDSAKAGHEKAEKEAAPGIEKRSKHLNSGKWSGKGKDTDQT